MPISGSSNAAANKDMKSKILTNGDTVSCYEQFLLFPHCFQKLSVVDVLK